MAIASLTPAEPRPGGRIFTQPPLRESKKPTRDPAGLKGVQRLCVHHGHFTSGWEEECSETLSGLDRMPKGWDNHKLHQGGPAAHPRVGAPLHFLRPPPPHSTYKLIYRTVLSSGGGGLGFGRSVSPCYIPDPSVVTVVWVGQAQLWTPLYQRCPGEARSGAEP